MKVIDIPNLGAIVLDNVLFVTDKVGNNYTVVLQDFRITVSCDDMPRDTFLKILGEGIDTELRDFVTDLAEHGTRFDTNPTIMGLYDPIRCASQYVEYIGRMDKSIRDRAKKVVGYYDRF